MNKQLEFPLFLTFKSRIINVQGYIRDTSIFVHGKGYVNDNDEVFVYNNRKTKIDPDFPTCFYCGKDSDGQLVFAKGSPAATRLFKTSYLKPITHTYISETTKVGEQMYDLDIVNDVNAATEKFKPIIDDNDDCLKKSVKMVILEKDVDINRYKSKMTTKYALTNMKSALIGITKLSINVFATWAELLGFGFKIFMYDIKTDPVDPLKQPIVYDSVTDSLKVLKSEEDLKEAIKDIKKSL